MKTNNFTFLTSIESELAQTFLIIIQDMLENNMMVSVEKIDKDYNIYVEDSQLKTAKDILEKLDI